MIKIPKEIEKVMGKLEGKGFRCHVAGACVADAMRGQEPLDWDIITDAYADDMDKLFRDGYVLDRENNIYRIEFDESAEGEDDGIILDMAHYSCDGKMVDTPEEDLKGRMFTCHAIGVDRNRNVIDPVGGKKDVTNRLCRLSGDAVSIFEESPVNMLKCIRTAAELGLDLPKDNYEAILKCRRLMSKVPVEDIRDEFIGIIDAAYAGKGLRMLSGAGLMEYIIGEKLANSPSKREKSDFDTLCDNIDKIKHVPERRLGCLYICFDGSKCDDAIKMLNYDEKTEQYLLDANAKMPVIYFIKTKQELKRFIADNSYDRYMYLHNLSKAQRIIWDGREDKIMNRNYLWAEIKNNGEIVFEEQLPVRRQEIIDAGYATEENIDKVMRQLLDAVYNTPQSRVNHDFLMETARKFKKSKLKVATRNVKWIR